MRGLRATLRRGLAGVLVCLAAPAGAEAPPASLAATPLSREQVLSFYMARGFSADAIAPYAGACVVSFTFRNQGGTPLRIRLADWATEEGVRFRALGDWEAEWERRGLAQPARVAFRWAQFPPEQVFEPGDWIMGMAALERRPAGAFRILARYFDDKEPHEIATPALRCSGD